MSDGLHRAVAAGFPALDLTKTGRQEINPFTFDEGDSLQTRDHTDERTIEKYADAMKRGRGKASFPPATVYVTDGSVRLVDGFHRLEASRRSIGKTKRGFLVEVVHGTEREAFLAALTVNSRHGLRLTGKDNEKRYLLACSDPILRQLPTRKLADFLDISKSAISRLRQKHPRTKPGGTGEASEADDNPFGIKRYSTLPPPTVPYGPAQPPKPLSPPALAILKAAGDSCAGEGGVSGPLMEIELTKAIGALPVDGQALDRAAREVFALATWLWKARYASELLTGPEEAERRLEDEMRDF